MEVNPLIARCTRILIKEHYRSTNVMQKSITYNTLLANVNSRSRSLYAIAPSICRLSVCRLSVVCRLSYVTFVRPTQAAQIFVNISMALGTLAIRGHPLKILRRSSQGNPSAGGVKHKRVAKYSDFRPIDGYIGNGAR